MKRLLAACLLTLALLGPGCSHQPTSYEGRLYYTAQEGGRYRIEWTDPGATAPHPLLGQDEEARGPAVAPDGLTLAYLRGSPPRVHVVSLATMADEQVSMTQETTSRPSWSTVGRRLAYLRYSPGGKVQLVVQAVGGAANVIYEARNLGLPTWSHLGNRVYYTEIDAAGASRVFSRKVDGSEPLLVLEGASQPTMAPDRSALAVVVADKLQIYDLGTKKLTMVSARPGITSPGWNPSGQMLCFVQGGQIWTVGDNGSNPRQITRSPQPILDVAWGKGF